MRVSVAPCAGFCFGVKRALKIAFDAAHKHAGDGPIFTLGPIIHNPQVVARLEREGLAVIDDLEDLADPRGGTMIVRSHGLPRDVLEDAERRGIELVDATCPFVKEAQERAEQLANEGYAVVIVGEKDHPEVLSIAGGLSSPAMVIADPEELDKLPRETKVGVVCQTTQPIGHLISVVNRLLEQAKEIKVFNTICRATFERQINALELARRVDIMLVVGGRNSANTRRLWKLCREAGCDAYHIETAEELKLEWLEGKEEVGITGGASTPQWIVDDVVSAVEGAQAPGNTGEESRP